MSTAGLSTTLQYRQFSISRCKIYDSIFHTCITSQTRRNVELVQIIMEYGSTPYVGMAPKKMASPLTNDMFRTLL